MNNVQPINFITLCAPHLGIDDWIRNKQYRCNRCFNLYSFAKCLVKTKLAIPTLKQLARMDKIDENNRNDTDNYLLYSMANDDQFIVPLSKFTQTTGLSLSGQIIVNDYTFIDAFSIFEISNILQTLSVQNIVCT